MRREALLFVTHQQVTKSFLRSTLYTRLHDVAHDQQPIRPFFFEVSHMASRYVVMVRRETWFDRLAVLPIKILKWAILIQLGLLLAAGVIGGIAHVAKLAIGAVTGAH